MQAQPEPSKAGHDQFIVWFKAQSFYTNLAFAHGDRLFDFEQSENTFRVLAVQTAWCVWQELNQRINRALFQISGFYKDGCLFHEWVSEAEKSLRG